MKNLSFKPQPYESVYWSLYRQWPNTAG